MTVLEREAALKWAKAKAEKYISETMSKYAATNYSAYKNAWVYGEDSLIRYQEKTNRAIKDKKKTGVCSEFSIDLFNKITDNCRQFARVSEPPVSIVTVKGTGDRSREMKGIGGHTFVLVNRQPDSLNAPVELGVIMPPKSGDWVILDGWLAALDHPLEDCIKFMNDDIIQFGNSMTVSLSWNPNLG